MAKAKAAINIYQAKTQLSRLVDEAEAGAEIVIARGGKPVAKLARLAPKRRKIRFGILKGKISVASDFDAPLPKKLLAGFGGG